MWTLLVLGALALPLGVLTAAARLGARWNRDDRAAAVRDLLAKYRGKLEKTSIDALRLTLIVRDRELIVELGEHGHTRYRIAVAAPGLTRFVLRPFRGGVQGLHLFPGLADRFAIDADDLALLARVWTPARSRAMAEHHAECTLVVTEVMVTLESPRPDSPEQIERGSDFVAEVAGIDLFGIAALAALPDATLHRGDVAAIHVTIAGPGGIRIGPIARGGTTVTRASCDGGEPREAIDIEDGGCSVEALAALPPELHIHVRDLGTAQLAWNDGALAITWPTIEDDPRRLIAAVELLRGLVAAPSAGVFR